MAKRNALGRGLGALIDDADKAKESESVICEIAIGSIVANPYQPRTRFDEESLKELSNSIKEIGIIQPVTLRKTEDGKYQIIAGERRYRAAKMAGLETITAYVRNADDEGMLEMALVENIQREDLDAIEISLSYQRLIEEYKYTQESLSERVGKKRSTISNYLRLLKLPAKIQKGIIDKEITMGHARALINIDDPAIQLVIYDEILAENYSVRKVEELVRKYNESGTVAKAEKPRAVKHPEEYKDLSDHLSKFFDTKIDFRIDNKGKGKIVIPFKSSRDLERILGILDNLDA